MNRSRTLTALLLLAVLLSASAGPAAEQELWRLQNIFACTTEGTHMSCGPHLQMAAGAGNGTFPTGLILVRDGEARTWIAEDATPAARDLGTRTWRLAPGGSSVVTRATWTMGWWSWETRRFAAAAGDPALLAGGGSSSFAPASPFRIPAGAHLAVRITGAGGPSLLDVFDEWGGDSPTTLTLAP